MNRLILCCLLLVLVLGFSATRVRAEDAQLAKLFTSRKVNGTLVLVNRAGSQRYLYNEARAAQPFLPASTFKIPNTLIALDQGVITPQELLRWDGRETGIPACNHDQTLASAFKNSCIWYYQELARRIGESWYQTWLQRIDYGNAQPEPCLTTFWLEGDLRISALQQVAFLKKVYQRTLPFKQGSYDTLASIMLVEQKPGYRLYAKTGWAGFGHPDQPQLGWYVGYVEAGTEVWFFALNIAITKPAEGGYRQQIVMEALKQKGLI